MEYGGEKRGPNFSLEDERALIQSVQKYISVIENKKTDGVSVRQKKDAWEAVGRIFNANVSIPRSVAALKDKYGNMKRKVKKEVADERKHVKGTGGGNSLPPSDMPEEKVALLEIMGHQATGLPSHYDKDASHFGSRVVWPEKKRPKQQSSPVSPLIISPSQVTHVPATSAETEDFSQSRLLPGITVLHNSEEHAPVVRDEARDIVLEVEEPQGEASESFSQNQSLVTGDSRRVESQGESAGISKSVWGLRQPTAQPLRTGVPGVTTQGRRRTNVRDAVNRWITQKTNTTVESTSLATTQSQEYHQQRMKHDREKHELEMKMLEADLATRKEILEVELATKKRKLEMMEELHGMDVSARKKTI